MCSSVRYLQLEDDDIMSPAEFETALTIATETESELDNLRFGTIL